MPKSQPVSLAAACIVIQICLLLISYLSVMLLSRSHPAKRAAASSYSTVIAWLLVALSLILFSQDFYGSWGAILEDVEIPTVPRGLSFLFVFIVDIAFVSVLILKTGGIKRSPLTSVLLLLPSLAIFLHEPRARFLAYSAVCAAIYSLGLKFDLEQNAASPGGDIVSARESFGIPAREDRNAEDWALLWGNLSCLALATLIGFITAPHS